MGSRHRFESRWKTVANVMKHLTMHDSSKLTWVKCIKCDINQFSVETTISIYYLHKQYISLKFVMTQWSYRISKLSYNCKYGTVLTFYLPEANSLSLICQLVWASIIIGVYRSWCRSIIILNTSWRSQIDIKAWYLSDLEIS